MHVDGNCLPVVLGRPRHCVHKPGLSNPELVNRLAQLKKNEINSWKPERTLDWAIVRCIQIENENQRIDIHLNYYLEVLISILLFTDFLLPIIKFFSQIPVKSRTSPNFGNFPLHPTASWNVNLGFPPVLPLASICIEKQYRILYLETGAS